MKKRILIIIAGVTAIILAIMLGTGFLVIQLLSQILRNPVIADLPEYNHSDRYYSEGFQDYTDYCKYYFSEDSDIIEALNESHYFRPVTDLDVADVKSFFDNFDGWVKHTEYVEKYDFQVNCIDTADYFYIENKDTCERYADYPDKYSAYNVYFFDTQTKTLFYIQSNI